MTPQERSNPRVARRVLDSLFSGASIDAGNAFQELLGETVQVLDREFPDRWGVTLYSDLLRLNVGWAECIVLTRRAVRVLLHEGMTPRQVKLVGRSYDRAPGCRMTSVPHEQLPNVLSILRPAHNAALRSAGFYTPHIGIRKAHSPGVTKLLSLPDPQYREHNDEPRNWAVCWKAAYWTANPEFASVSSAGGSLFGRRGISPGDRVYVFSQRSGKLLLGGRMQVERIVSREEAVRIRRTENLYPAPEWVLGKEGTGTPLHHNRLLAPEISRRLRFNSPHGAEDGRLLFRADDSLDPQTLRVPRELTPDSAALLDEIIELTEPGTPAGVRISEHFLREARAERDDENALTFAEGRPFELVTTRYERDLRARQKCLERHGAVCAACDFDFGKVYGKVAAGFIHVHHLNPLAAVRAGYAVDPLHDLRPLCPNCHSVAHMREEPYSVEELKRMMARNGLDAAPAR